MCRIHSRQAAQPRAPHEVEQQRFGIVVHVVRHGHGAAARLLHEGLKPCVAQAAGCHFDAFARTLGLAGRVEVLHVQRHAEPFAQLAHKGFVAVALGAPQVEVAVRCRDTDAPFVQQQEQRHRIGAAAQCHEAGRGRKLDGRECAHQ